MMAQAAFNAGVITENSTAALEKAMRAGKVAADDVMPAFAKVLNDVTANANFDSLQTSINRLKNSWTEMVESANFEGLYKGIIDGAKGVVSYMTESFWPKVAAGASGIFTVMSSGAFRSFVGDAKKAAEDAQKEFKRLYNITNNFTRENLGGKIYDFKGVPSAPIPKKPNEDSFTVYEDYAKAMAKWEKQLLKTTKGMQSYVLVNKEAFKSIDDGGKAFSKAITEAQKYNQSLIDMNSAMVTMGRKPILSKHQINSIIEANKQMELMRPTVDGINENINVLGATVNKAKIALANFGRALLSAFSTIAISAAVSAVVLFIGKLIEARKEAKRIEGIADDIVEKVETAAGENSTTLIQLTNIKKALNDINVVSNEAKRAQLINEVNKALGRTGDNLLTIKDDIKTKVIPAIDDYIAKIKETAKQQAILSLVSESTSKVLVLEAKNKALTEDENYGKKATYQTGSIYSPIGGPVSQTELLTPEAQKIQGKIDKNNKEIDELNKGIERIIKMADEGTLSAIYGGKSTVISGQTNDDNDPKTTKGKTPSSVLNDYKKSLKELDNQLAAGAILISEYNNSVKKLNTDTFKELSGFGWEDAISKISKQKGGKKDVEVMKSIEAAAKNAILEALDDPKSIEEADKAVQQMADKAYKAWSDAFKRYRKLVKKNPALVDVDTSEAYMKSNKPKRGQTFTERETYLDTQFLKGYEKDLENLEQYKGVLEDAIANETSTENIRKLNKLLDEIIEKIERMKMVSGDLKAKVDLAKIEADLAKLKQQGIDAVFKSFTTLSDGVERLYNAYKAVMQLNDKGWQNEALEEFLTKLNLIIQALEVMKSVYSALKIVEETYTKIKEKNTAKMVALNGIAAVSEEAKASASAKAAVAGAASSVASMPVVGWALAGVAIAGIIAAIIAGMNKFATGGFVGGNSYHGDKNIARVNSGELILNPTQQRNLLNLANGKATGSGGQVEFKIKGDQLVGVLNNYGRLRS